MDIRLIGMAFLTSLLAACAIASSDTLRVAGNRLFVPVKINGVETEALLDSGAEMTLVDAAFARQLALVAVGKEQAKGTGGTQEVQFVENVDIEATGIDLSDRTVVTLDLSDISQRLVGEPVNVVIGRELFDSGRFHLDVEGGRFFKLRSARDPKGVRLPLIDSKGIKQMPITIEMLREVYADFDLGNGSEVLVGRPYALANGLLAPGRIVGTREGGGIGGPISRDLVVLGTIVIAGVRFQNVVAAVDATESASDANVGVSLLRNFVMTIDFSENTVWLVSNDPAR